MYCSSIKVRMAIPITVRLNLKINQSVWVVNWVIFLIESEKKQCLLVKCLRLVLSHAGETRNTNTTSICYRDSLKLSVTNNETHNINNAFTMTHYYHVLSRDEIAWKAGPGNVLNKTTHTRYKITTCIRYNTDKYKTLS